MMAMMKKRCEGKGKRWWWLIKERKVIYPSLGKTTVIGIDASFLSSHAHCLSINKPPATSFSKHRISAFGS